MKPRYLFQIALGFVVVAAILVTIGTLAILTTRQYVAAREAVQHTYQVQALLRDDWSALLGSESAVRGYVISGNVDYVALFQQRTAAQKTCTADLNRLTAGNTREQRYLDRLQPLIDKRLGVLRHAVAVTQKAGLLAVRGDVHARRGFILMAEIRKIIGDMNDDENIYLAERLRIADTQGRATLLSLGAGLVLAILLLPGMYALIVSEAGRRLRAERSLQETNSTLEERVRERTAAQETTNAQLRAEIALREGIGRELAESEERFRNMADSAPVLLWVTDAELDCVWVNRRWIEVTGRGQVPADCWEQDVHPDDLDGWMSELHHARATCADFATEVRLRHEDGYIWMLATGTPRLDEELLFAGLIGTCTDISAQKQTDALRQQLFDREQGARRQAEELNRAKDEFLHVLSHELRTPLTSMLGWANLLRSGQLDAQTTANALEVIERQVRAQSALISDLTDLSQISSGKLRLSVRPIELQPVVELAIEAARPSAEAREITLEIALQLHAGPVIADPQRLQQVIWNLLSNSIKFTPRGGRVEVRLTRIGFYMELAVQDNGIGIERGFLPHVFDRFRQADSSPTRPAGGLGLGLNIVRQLVESQGGTVRAESAGINQGATFTVRLPTAPVESDAEPRPFPMPLVASDRGPASSSDDSGVLQGLRLLLVEDEPDSRMLIAEILRGCGAQITAVASAEEALAQLEEWLPDVLISDIGMPEKDGLELIRQIRAWPAGHSEGAPNGASPTNNGSAAHARQHQHSQSNPANSSQVAKLPAIALTAYATAEDREAALQAGYEAFLAKPVEPSTLVDEVARIAGVTPSAGPIVEQIVIV